MLGCKLVYIYLEVTAPCHPQLAGMACPAASCGQAHIKISVVDGLQVHTQQVLTPGCI